MKPGPGPEKAKDSIPTVFHELISNELRQEIDITVLAIGSMAKMTSE